MQSEANYKDILALLKAANQAAKPASGPEGAVKPWQAERSGQFRSDQASVVTDVQDSLAKGLTQSLGAYLRAGFETTSVSVTQMTFSEAIEHAGAGAYFLAVRFQEMPAIIQIEQSLVFPLIDLLLGGTGQGQADNREVTEIEDHVMEGVGKIICHEIAAGWRTDPGGCDLIGVQKAAQLQRLLSGTDQVVVSQFESKMADATGHVAIFIPGTTFNALLRRMSVDAEQPRSSKADSASSKLGEKMLACSFPVSLGVTAIKLPVDKILTLAPGQVCDLGVPVSQSAALIIAGRDAFEANPLRQGLKRAAHLGKQRIPCTERTA